MLGNVGLLNLDLLRSGLLVLVGKWLDVGNEVVERFVAVTESRIFERFFSISLLEMTASSSVKS